MSINTGDEAAPLTIKVYDPTTGEMYDATGKRVSEK